MLTPPFVGSMGVEGFPAAAPAGPAVEEEEKEKDEGTVVVVAVAAGDV